jgi:hypothetical protein
MAPWTDQPGLLSYLNIGFTIGVLCAFFGTGAKFLLVASEIENCS